MWFAARAMLAARRAHVQAHEMKYDEHSLNRNRTLTIFTGKPTHSHSHNIR